ncbi:MAG TPA: arginine--tRNA ligase, partial [Flavisolibacter sp.]|nr:arginine--tRNA ligase [Flavisolibacter sp.]
MSIVQKIKEVSAFAIEKIYKIPASADDIAVNQTKPEFEGNYTVVLFTLVKQLKKSPELIGQEIGNYLLETSKEIFTDYNVIKGFLNLSVSDQYLVQFLSEDIRDNRIENKNPAPGKRIIVEYSSPNTNKPLHLGHLRNNFLGWSVAAILKARGNQVYKTCIVNDRGIHICKSMIAWELFANGQTPDTTHTKGDHFVGDYYVKCETLIKEEAAAIQLEVEKGHYEAINEKDKQKLVELQELINAIIGDNDRDKEKLKKLNEDRKELIRSNTSIMRKAQRMLLDWENGEPKVIDLWKRMNTWVYKGFDETYERIGSDFDKIYYESQTYLLGRKFVEEGLRKGVFFRKHDGSVWIDLTKEGLDEKLVLR